MGKCHGMASWKLTGAGRFGSKRNSIPN
ncbi:hypothetical protein CCACVL1_30152 [Corchorus capsularis]|uniref:Uncharacterized protein n=1 Tax=Corchorus capsularis TaxID=210143 RepID=A0A1R3FYQ8_COCAP|nr:hypothetical protein CCACVL1_30152 [Corchorus capsularis]